MNERADYIPAALPADDADSCDVVTIPAALGGLRLDQALAKLFPEEAEALFEKTERDALQRRENYVRIQKSYDLEIEAKKAAEQK